MSPNMVSAEAQKARVKELEAEVAARFPALSTEDAELIATIYVRYYTAGWNDAIGYINNNVRVGSYV